MKKLFLSLAMMMAVVFSANAQEFSKGDMTLGGIVSLEIASQKDLYSDRYYEVAPSFRYFFADKWAVGATLDLEHGSYKDKINDTKSKYNDLYLAPNISYIFPIGERWGMENKVSLYLRLNNGFATSLYYIPSFYFFINDSWAINAYAGAVGYKFEGEQFDFHVGSYVGCGVSWRF